MAIKPGWYRENQGSVKPVRTGIIIDHGVLTQAKTFGAGFTFNEKHEMGVAPLVLLGNKEFIFKEMDEWEDAIASGFTRGIENKVKEFPKIRMLIQKYQVKGRYEGAFPMLDAIGMLTTAIAGLGSGAVNGQLATPIGALVRDIGGGIADLVGWYKTHKGLFNNATYKPKKQEEEVKKINAKAKKEDILYIRFHYDLCDDSAGAVIGEEFVSFLVISRLLEASLGGRPAMPAKAMKKDT